MPETRARFAPSPTGYLHIGGLRTALFNYLLVKSRGGKLILRVEDTDQKREVKGAIKQLIDILSWVGIEFDEGPDVGGEHGPYVQSQRLDIYEKYADELLKSGKAYRCFCAAERLAEMRRERQMKKLPPRYDGTCRNLSEDKIKERLRGGEKFVVRQKMPLSGEIKVYDELRGEIKFKAEDLDDHILIKSNGIPTYQFANVVDDHLMEITDVLRGDEWIASFPKNILLYRAFGWEPPKFVHLPLVLDKNGGKLSKRQGDVAVEDFRKKGYLPEALINFCALLGWHPKNDDEILSMERLIKEFNVKDMGVSPAIFDIDKLDYLNGYHIRQKPLDELTELCLPYLISAGFIEKTQSSKLKAQNDNLEFKNKLTDKIIGIGFIKKIIGLEQERLKRLSEIGELTEFFFCGKVEYPVELLSWKKLTIERAKENLKIIHHLLEKIPEENWTNDSIEEDIVSYLRAKELKIGEYLWPMRVALTGRKASPSPFDVAEVLGKEESLKRIKAAME